MNLRELTEIISGVRKVAFTLHDAANGKIVRGEFIPEGTVLASQEGLQAQAEYLEEVADALCSLVPPRPITLMETENESDPRE